MSNRLVFFDLETTGLSYQGGDRIIQFGGIEIINGLENSRVNILINPQIPIHPDATAIHGITNDDVKSSPLFRDVAAELHQFLSDAKIIAHNGRKFDLPFINHHLIESGLSPLPEASLIDTLELARERFFGKPNSLDALCRRFKIDTSIRTKHDALIDTELLYQVYKNLVPDEQVELILQAEEKSFSSSSVEADEKISTKAVTLSDDEKEQHQKFLADYFSGIKSNFRK